MVDFLIDLEDKDGGIAGLDRGLEEMTQACWEAEDLLIELLPALRAVSRGEALPPRLLWR